MKFYCINLDNRRDRLAQITEEVKRADGELVRISAVNAQELDFNAYAGGFRNTGEIACWMSHLRALKTALADNPKEEFVFIIEDDVLFIRDYKEYLEKALEAAPKNGSLFYIGYLIFRFTKNLEKDLDETTKNSYWRHLAPIYATHGYSVRTSELPRYIHFLEGCNKAIDDYMTENWSETYAIRQPIVYQRLESPSDVTGWALTVNPFNTQIYNPLKLRYIWQKPTATNTPNTKLLHVLPGQKLYFDIPTGWQVRKWQTWDDIYEYKRFNKIVPFEFWALLFYGGMAFRDELSPWLSKHWRLDEPVMRRDLVQCGKYNQILIDIINEIIIEDEPEQDSNPHWEIDKILPEHEVAPLFA